MSFNSGWSHDGNGGYLPGTPDGGGGGDDGDIVVTGSLPGIQVYLDDLLDVGLNWNDLYPVDPLGGSGGDGEGDGGNQEQPQDNEDEHQCKSEAVGAAKDSINERTDNDSIRDNSDRQPEYGLTIARDGDSYVNSEVVRGQSYRDSDTPSTSLGKPDGYDWSDVIATVHSHPTSGDSAIDRRNRAPSDSDWLAADRAVELGADPSQLTIYIIDKGGTMRAFEYMTREERNATTGNPSGNQDSASDGTVVSEDGDSCSSG